MSTILRIKVLKGSVILAAAVAAMALGPAPAEAAVQNFFTPDGATVGGQPVDAKAQVTTLTNQIQIVLTNLQADPTSVIQALSDFKFTIAGPGSLTGSSLTGATGQEIFIADNGSITNGAALNTPSGVGWVYSALTPTTGYLNVLGAGGAGPEHLIIGPPGGATYSANNSIEGNEAHNPFLDQIATFTITATGVTANTLITSAVFSFGTTAGNDVAAVPEPASFATVGMGTLLGLGYAWRRRKRAAV